MAVFPQFAGVVLLLAHCGWSDNNDLPRGEPNNCGLDCGVDLDVQVDDDQLDVRVPGQDSANKKKRRKKREFQRVKIAM